MFIPRGATRLLTMAAIALVAAGPAVGQPMNERVRPQAPVLNFRHCDGYGGPSATGDGMTKQATGLGGLFVPSGGDGNTVRENQVLGASGAAACEAALADPKLLDKFWIRRANLLRALGMHRLAMGDRAGAEAAWRQALEAVRDPTDPFVGRGLGVGITLGRAVAANVAGDSQAAERLALEAWALRPLHRGTALAALMAMGSTARPEARDRVMRDLVRLHPDQAPLLYDYLLDQGRFAEALPLFGLLKPPTPEYAYTSSDPDVRRQYALAQGLVEARFWMQHGVERAYMLAALGRADEARVALTEVEDAFKRVTAPPDQAAPVTREQRRAAARRERRAKFDKVTPVVNQRRELLARQGAEFLAIWKPIVEARIAVSNGDAAPTRALSTAATNWAVADVLAAAAQKSPTDAELAARARQARAAMAKPPTKGDLSTLFEFMPESDWRENSVTRDEDLRSWRDLREDIRSERDGVITVGFKSPDGSGAEIEEIALLKAAELVAGKGKGGFVITNRRDIANFVDSYANGMLVARHFMGYSSELTIVPVDPAALPPAYADAPWRVITVAEVYAALAPVYGQGSARTWPQG